jgi:hypothetical protein
MILKLRILDSTGSTGSEFLDFINLKFKIIVSTDFDVRTSYILN